MCTITISGVDYIASNGTCALSGPIVDDTMSILHNRVSNDPMTFFDDQIVNDDNTGFYKKICINGIEYIFETKQHL